ncbi:hypothetical protein F2P81_020694 [Scophthalmus maximus]|uniref:Uncharacterized protein n=1 Tax=Scophthalmus maximus TaxID=52904 RepID=A0A6A4S0P9_SCOMX|nr:hypothetical protein F2P81_020694 [Scophthalmus maximus]
MLSVAEETFSPSHSVSRNHVALNEENLYLCICVDCRNNNVPERSGTRVFAHRHRLNELPVYIRCTAEKPDPSQELNLEGRSENTGKNTKQTLDRRHDVRTERQRLVLLVGSRTPALRFQATKLRIGLSSNGLNNRWICQRFKALEHFTSSPPQTSRRIIV